MCRQIRYRSGSPQIVRWAVLLAVLLSGGVLAAADDRPNVVLIFADDLGWQDTGFSGSDYCETPHLDRLAKQGMWFRHAYASAGNCAPSRACLVSGQYTPRHHVYAVGSTSRGPEELMRLIPVPNRLTLPAATVTLAEAMKQAGYATGMFGKCHLTARNGNKSEQSGFDVVKVSQHSLNSPDADDPKAIFSITSAACQFMEEHRRQPFFAYISHYAVHTRWQARPGTLERFRRKQPGTAHDDPLFAACIADLDTGVGQVLEKLRDLELADNTLVVFTSDNGGMAWSQEPLRGKKGCYYEGGIRVPMIARWPGVVPAGTTCDVPVTNADFYPTFLAAANAASPADHPLDGASLLPLFRGDGELNREAIFWHFPGYLNGPVPRGRDSRFRTRPVTVMRSGDWKLHLYHEEWLLDGGRDKLATNSAVELYNIVEDAGERKNLAGSHSEQRDRLLDAMHAWWGSIDARLPRKPTPADRRNAPPTKRPGD